MKPKSVAAEGEAINCRLSVRQTQRRKLFRPDHKFLRGRYWGLGWRVQDIKLQHKSRRCCLWPSYSFFLPHLRSGARVKIPLVLGHGASVCSLRLVMRSLERYTPSVIARFKGFYVRNKRRGCLSGTRHFDRVIFETLGFRGGAAGREGRRRAAAGASRNAFAELRKDFGARGDSELVHAEHDNAARGQGLLIVLI
jgi:hypothetical protein